MLGTWDIGKPCKKVIFRFDEMQKEELIGMIWSCQKKDSAGRSSDRRAYPQNLKGVSVQAEKIGYNEKITCLFSKQDGEKHSILSGRYRSKNAKGILETGFSKV